MAKIKTQYGQPANYNVTPATRADGQGSALEVDANGNLKTVSGGTGASSNQVQGTAADNAAAVGNPVRVGQRYNSSAPTYDNGDIADFQADVNGNTKVREQYAPGYEDNTNNKAIVEHRYTSAVISSATTTTIKSGAGLVHTISILGGTLGAITVYDNTAGSGTTICPTFTPTAAVPCPPIILDETFATGLTIVTAAATIINVSYR